MNRSSSLFSVLAAREEPRDPDPRPEPTTLTFTIENADYGFSYASILTAGASS